MTRSPASTCAPRPGTIDARADQSLLQGWPGEGRAGNRQGPAQGRQAIGARRARLAAGDRPRPRPPRQGLHAAQGSSGSPPIAVGRDCARRAGSSSRRRWGRLVACRRGGRGRRRRWTSRRLRLDRWSPRRAACTARSLAETPLSCRRAPSSSGEYIGERRDRPSSIEVTRDLTSGRSRTASPAVGSRTAGATDDQPETAHLARGRVSSVQISVDRRRRRPPN